MNKQIIISIIFLLSFGFISHSKGQALIKVQSELIKNQVDSVFNRMVVYAENLEFDKLGSGVDDHHEAGFISNNKYYSSYANLINDVTLNAQGINKQDISIQEKKITVLSDNMVLLTASGVSKAYINDGREIAVNFHWSFIYERINNNWKVIYSHQSTSR